MGHGWGASARAPCARADVPPFSYLGNGWMDCAEIWFVVRDPLISLAFYKSWWWGTRYRSTCARVHPISVSRERLDGLRWNLVCGRTTSYALYAEWGISTRMHVQLYTHLSASVRSRWFIAQRASYWLANTYDNADTVPFCDIKLCWPAPRLEGQILPPPPLPIFLDSSKTAPDVDAKLSVPSLASIWCLPRKFGKKYVQIFKKKIAF